MAWPWCSSPASGNKLKIPSGITWMTFVRKSFSALSPVICCSVSRWDFGSCAARIPPVIFYCRSQPGHYRCRPDDLSQHLKRSRSCRRPRVGLLPGRQRLLDDHYVHHALCGAETIFERSIPLPRKSRPIAAILRRASAYMPY